MATADAEPRDRELDRAIARVSETAWRLLTGLPAYYGLYPGWRLRIDGIVAEVLLRRMRLPDPAGTGGIGLRTAAEEMTTRIAGALRMDRAGDDLVMLGEEVRGTVESAVGGWLGGRRPAGPVISPSGSPSKSPDPGVAVRRSS